MSLTLITTSVDNVYFTTACKGIYTIQEGIPAEISVYDTLVDCIGDYHHTLEESYDGYDTVITCTECPLFALSYPKANLKYNNKMHKLVDYNDQWSFPFYSRL